MRIRSAGAYVALVVGLSVALAGCQQLGMVRAMKAYKDGNKLYASNDFRGAAAKYEEAIADDPDGQLNSCGESPGCIYFFLANSYDNMYRPARRGEPANDAYLEKAVQNYKKASETIVDPLFKSRSLEYLVASYGPDKLNDPTMAEPIIKQMIELDPAEPGNYFVLARLYQDSGEYELAEQTFLQAKEARPNDPAVYLQLANFYNTQGDFAKTIEYLNERIKIEPNNPEAHYTVATYYWDKANRDFRLTDKEKIDYVMDGLESVDKAISIKSDYMEAIAYKNLLLRLQANLEKDPKKQQALLRQADELRDKATELRKQKSAGTD
ncbi:MAG TPA: tetratricopeptide repeat protein [Vicinamibacterales bacterium]|nr:tetratricopeptide repeat protein [Vicinamibacterales bacterium]